MTGGLPIFDDDTRLILNSRSSSGSAAETHGRPPQLPAAGQPVPGLVNLHDAQRFRINVMTRTGSISYPNPRNPGQPGSARWPRIHPRPLSRRPAPWHSGGGTWGSRTFAPRTAHAAETDPPQRHGAPKTLVTPPSEYRREVREQRSARLLAPMFRFRRRHEQ